MNIETEIPERLGINEMTEIPEISSDPLEMTEIPEMDDGTDAMTEIPETDDGTDTLNEMTEIPEYSSQKEYSRSRKPKYSSKKVFMFLLLAAFVLFSISVLAARTPPSPVSAPAVSDVIDSGSEILQNTMRGVDNLLDQF